MAQLLFSNLVARANSQTNGFPQIVDSDVVFDLDRYQLINAISFKNCRLFRLNNQISSVNIDTNSSFRVEDCILESNICVWGKRKSHGDLLDSLGHKGPNVFFDNVNGKEFEWAFPHNPSEPVRQLPQIQISGHLSHVRVSSKGGIIGDLAFLQAVFNNVEILGAFNQIQINQSKGSLLSFKEVDTKFLWIYQKLHIQVLDIDFDMDTIHKYSNRVKGFVNDDHIQSNILNLLELLKRNKQGRKYNILHSAYCYFKCKGKWSQSKINNLIIYGWLRNFNSFLAMLSLSSFVVLLFSLFYYLIHSQFSALGTVIFSNGNEVNYLDTLYFSAVTFTTVGYGDISPTGILKLLASIEGFLGILLVLVSSFVFSKKYSDY